MKALRVIARLLLGLVGLVVLLYLVALAINWRDQPPSEDALAMRRVIAERPVVADADNAFIYVMGFNAPEEVDPAVLGAQRVAWLESLNHDPALINADPERGKGSAQFVAGRTPAIAKYLEACKPSGDQACGAAIDAASTEMQWSETDLLQLTRYRRLISHPRWRERLMLDYRAPFPPYGPVMGGQKMLFLELYARRTQLPPAGLREELAADIQFWREVLASSDVLITKMIANAGMRNHFHYANLILRTLPPDAALKSLPEAWSVPLSNDERSLRRVMAGELAFSTSMMRMLMTEGMPPMPEGFEALDDRSFAEHLLGPLWRPFFQVQDTENHQATSHREFLRRFEVPLDRYLEVVKHPPAREKSPTRVYNLGGDLYRGDVGPIYDAYALRAGTVEGMRRAALLTARLRSRGVAAADVPRELAASDLRNPFTGAPFEWDEKERSIVYEGPEDHEWKRHAYLY